MQALSVPEPARHTVEISAPGTVDAVLARQLVFVTGKGGVGKTTVAAAFALAVADGGRRSLLCELGGQARVRPRPTARTRRGASRPGAGERLDRPRRRARRVAGPQPLPDRRGAARSLGAFDHLVAAARELVAIGKAWDLTRADPGRLVVLDAPASGHAIALLEARPDRFDAAEVEVVQRALGASPNPGLRAAGAVVRRAWSRARAQEEQRANLRASVAVPIVELPFLFVAALGPAELRALARRLAAGR